MKKVEKVIIYILSHFNSEPKKIGKVKLAKLLWFCEREYMYKYHAHLLDDLEFIKLDHGPVPKKYEKILKDMEKKNLIHVFEIPNFDRTQISFHSLKEPDLSEFSAQEISVIDSVIYKLRDKTASELSKLSHDEFWDNTELGEVIPAEVVFATKDVMHPTDDDVQWAMQVLEKKGINAH